MRESNSLSSCPPPPPNQSTINATSSMSPASESSTPLELSTNQKPLKPSNPQEEPGCTLSPASSENPAAASSNSSPETILSKVEAVIESVVDSMLHKQPELAIPIRVKKKQTQTRRSVIVGMMDSGAKATGRKADEAGSTRVLVRFPGRDERESWRFS